MILYYIHICMCGFYMISIDVLQHHFTLLRSSEPLSAAALGEEKARGLQRQFARGASLRPSMWGFPENGDYPAW